VAVGRRVRVAQIRPRAGAGQLQRRDVDSNSEVAHVVVPRLARRVFYTLHDGVAAAARARGPGGATPPHAGLVHASGRADAAWLSRDPQAFLALRGLPATGALRGGDARAGR